jgi:transcriptional regulator with XRE-family HTH domain
MNQDPRVGEGERNLADHVRFERELRNWSTAELARAVSDAGCPMNQSAVWRIENGEPRRKISVDELIAFSKVFEKSISDLLQPPTTEYPENLIKEYLSEWLKAEQTVWHKRLDASVRFRDVATILAVYPGATPHVADLAEDIMEREEWTFLKPQVSESIRDLPAWGNLKHRGVRHLGNTKFLISYWKRKGMTHKQMISEADRLGLDGPLNGAIKGHILGST